MALFRKRPVVVQAYRYEGTTPLPISTLEGTIVASPGDWIITGVAGETYPCKDEIFRQTYEALSDDEVNALWPIFRQEQRHAKDEG